jgi:hypothetical protein
MMNRMIHQRSLWLLPIALALFVITRIGYLNLPFYWDEAWSYANAVLDMVKTGSLSGNPELTRGHPWLFYILATCWAKGFGTSLVSLHTFALMIAVLLLLTVFCTAREWFDGTTAWSAMLFMALQPAFLAQSTMLLPEIMLTLWGLLTVRAYVGRKWAQFAVFSVMTVMTKETGMVLIGTLFLDKLFLEGIMDRDRPGTARLIKELALLCIPVLTFAGFLVLQKIRFGWFLYPEHVNLAVLDPHEIMLRMRTFLSKLLFQQGRIFFFLISMAALIYRMVKKRPGALQSRILAFSAIFILLYISFSSVNFFTTRYLLSVFPFYLIPGAWLITSTLPERWMRIAVISGLALLFTWQTVKSSRNENDTSLGFKNSVLVQKKAIAYAQENHWQEKTIYSAFLMQYYLSIPALGYLEDVDQPFTRISNSSEKTYDIFIFCSNENDPRYPEITRRRDVTLLKRFERYTAWVEIYGIGER